MMTGKVLWLLSMGVANSFNWENLVISLEMTLSQRKENNSYSELVSVYSDRSFTHLPPAKTTINREQLKGVSTGHAKKKNSKTPQVKKNYKK